MAAQPLSPWAPEGAPGHETVLHLFSGPYVTTCGTRREVPEGSKRLLAYVALNHGRVDRRCVAGELWPVGDDLRASGNLRSALWRLRAVGVDLVAADKWSLRLCEGVRVDCHLVSDWASRLIRGTAGHDDLTVPLSWSEALNLLPGWYDDWVTMERERVRQRVLHALEVLSRRLVEAARCAEAVEAAMMAVAAEPLRESAQRVLIEAHLAEGNWAEGRRSFEAYRELLWGELGVRPTAGLASTVAPPWPAGHGGLELSSR